MWRLIANNPDETSVSGSLIAPIPIKPCLLAFAVCLGRVDYRAKELLVSLVTPRESVAAGVFMLVVR